MTNAEAIETIKLAIAEVEWEYPLDYAIAFDMAIKSLEKDDKEFDVGKYRLNIKKSILHYLVDEWNNHKRGRHHKENQPLYDKETGKPMWVGLDLDCIMEKVIKGIWSAEIPD